MVKVIPIDLPDASLDVDDQIEPMCTDSGWISIEVLFKAKQWRNWPGIASAPIPRIFINKLYAVVFFPFCIHNIF